MSFKLSRRSIKRLKTGDPYLLELAQVAIKETKTDFGTLEVLRTLKTQKEYLAKGVTKTLKSKHLKGLAMDNVAYVAGKVCWEHEPYFEVCRAFYVAWKKTGKKKRIRWGGSWSEFKDKGFNPKKEYLAYIDRKRKQGRRPFCDLPHFEIVG